MKKLLLELGFTEKEADVYLALLEFGTQPASVIAKKTGYPKSTILFLFDGLLKKGYVRKSQRGRVQYFYADPSDFEKLKTKEIEDDKSALDKTIPLLKEFKSPYTSEPKVTFFEGTEGCRKAYSMILDSKTDVFEFGIHGDLEEKLGEKFMNDFIKARVKKKINLKAIAKKDKIHERLSKLNKAELREIQYFPKNKGMIYSSIAIFEDKVLLLNLFQDAFAIVIDNKEVAETLRTIFKISWK
ncbi:TrmB family transcriptional regulator [Patescibacteria group bacterium]